MNQSIVEAEEERFKPSLAKNYYDPTKPTNQYRISPNYTIDEEINKYNHMSPFDRIHNKRHDWKTPIAMS